MTRPCQGGEAPLVTAADRGCVAPRRTLPFPYNHHGDETVIDLTKIKPGDAVTVRMFVVGIEHDQALVSLASDRPAVLALAQSMVATHTPKALSVGDRVIKVAGVTFTGVIVAIDDDRAWVTWGKRDGGWGEGDNVCHLSDLERV